MFRRWTTILGPQNLKVTGDPMEVAKVDADVIMTAAVLGFTAGRLALGHPIEYVIAEEDDNPKSKKYDKKKVDDHAAAVARINAALGAYNVRGLQAKVGTPVAWEKGAVITGSPSGSALPFENRHAKHFDELETALREAASVGSIDKDPDDEGQVPIGYQGFGAYTGYITDPIEHRPGIRSTMRYNVPADGYGERWAPPEYKYFSSKKGEEDTVIGTHKQKAWGLIAGADEIDTMAAVPYKLASTGNVVGYTHGMIQSIYDAVQKGPWCTPFEIAVGTKTRKLASCFTCTMFMYAAGFPPSGSHLGRGESWVPFYEMRPAKELDLLDSVKAFFYTPPKSSNHYVPMTDTAIEAINNRWRLECWQHLRLGIEIMKQDGMRAITAGPHRERLARLEEFLAERANDVYAGANLILDAVTVHDNEMVRLNRTIVDPSTLDDRLIVSLDDDLIDLNPDSDDDTSSNDGDTSPILVKTGKNTKKK